MSTRCKVLSILGPGRSGTTILGNILGEIPGFFSAGEVRFIWKRGVIEHWKCGCGVPTDECNVWSAVFQRMAAKGVTVIPTWVVQQSSLSIDPAEVVSWQNELSLLRSR